MPNRATLLDRFSTLERQRKEILEGIASVDPGRLRTQPYAGAWSVAQIVSHLSIADEGMLGYLNKKIEVGGHAPVGASAPFRLALLNVALVLPIKYKAPRVVATVPECSMAEAQQRWDTIRGRMHGTFETIPERLIGHGLFKHPSAGKFNLIQGLRFIGMHVEHHRPQIDRTLRRVGG
jgi:uncharacterized damage-inducible protein DinB